MEEKHLILLVEDDPTDEMLALRALAKADPAIKVEVARDGVEALRYLSTPSLASPDLILLDLKLPKLSGVEVLRGIREEVSSRHIPVVILTSSNEQIDVIGCFEYGANGFVQKSVDFSDYMEKVGKLADYWLNVNEPCRPAGLRRLSQTARPN